MRHIKIYFFILFLDYIGGCLNPFAPPVDKNTRSDIIWLEQTSPENVIINFKMAYEHRDYDHYINCLDRSFTFCYLHDQTNEQKCYGLENSGNTIGEKSRTRALFSTYERITLDPWQILTSYTEITNTDTLYIYKVLFTLQVEDLDGTYPTSTAQGFAIFKLKKQAPPESNLFRIAYWFDESIGETR